MKKDCYLVIAWPKDHGEDLSDLACQLQDFLDSAQVGGAKIISPLFEETQAAIEQYEWMHLP